MSNIGTLLKASIGERTRSCNLDARGASLAGVDLSSLSADAVDFRAADLRGTMFCEARLTGCHLEGARFEDADWSGATLRLCALDGAHGAGARFDYARLEDSIAEAADFSRATLRGAHLTETSFSRAVLREAIFDGAEGDGIEFRGADLSSASLKGVRFDEADFRGADLRDADLSRGRFHSADFRGAILDGTNFEGADYSGATFDHGDAPASPTPPAEKVREPGEAAAALHILNDFVALLPAAISGAQPEETWKRLQQLIDQTTASAGYSREQQQAVQKYFSDIIKPGGFDTTRLQQVLAALNSDSDEPPEELKAWLEPLMKAMQKKERP